MEKRTRNPAITIALILMSAILGLGSRRYASLLPEFLAAHTGDAAWALALFLAFALLLPKLSTSRIAVLALFVSILVEVSQLYHAPWIDSIRSTMIGHLALGSGFDPVDLARYAAGIGIGVVIDTLRMRRNPEKRSAP
jgi:hypothetical protein